MKLTTLYLLGIATVLSAVAASAAVIYLAYWIPRVAQVVAHAFAPMF